MKMDGEVRPRSVAGWALVMAGLLYATFHGSAILTDAGDEWWWLGLLVHGLLILSLMVGLIGARHRLDLEGRARTTWTASTVLAFLGVTLGHVFWSVAMIGIAAVALMALHQRIVATVMTLGAIGWLYLYLIGVRVGDENGRLINPVETRAAVLALTLMAAGIIVLGCRSFRAAPEGARRPLPEISIGPARSSPSCANLDGSTIGGPHVQPATRSTSCRSHSLRPPHPSCD